MKNLSTYIKTLKRIDIENPSQLRGYNKLTKSQKDTLKYFSADISNYLGEFNEGRK